jgi:hypothetical protein
MLLLQTDKFNNIKWLRIEPIWIGKSSNAESSKCKKSNVLRDYHSTLSKILLKQKF